MLAHYLANPLTAWLVVAAVLLIAELATGSGWLLWPSASAAVVGLISLTGAHLPAPIQVMLFAILTLLSTILARRLLPDGRLRPGPNINDRMTDLVGKSGKVVQAFKAGEGRVMVDGAEWIARAAGAEPEVGSQVEVVAVLGGAKLSVKPL